MNIEDVRHWLATVHGGLTGYIDLRGIDPDQERPPQTALVETIEEAVAWCARTEGDGWNLYAGLARRGSQRDAAGRIVRGETNLAACQVLWIDLDEGTVDEHQQRLRQLPVQPTLVIDSGNGTHAIWQLEQPIACVSASPWPQRMRWILRGLQDAAGGDPSVCEPARIFRVAGTTNYPNGRKRTAGATVRKSQILQSHGYLATIEDFEDLEHRGRALDQDRPQPVVGTNERLPANVEVILDRVPRMKRVFFCEERLRDKTPSDEDYAIAAGLWRHAPWLCSRDIASAIRYRRVALAHLVRGSHKTDGYYAATVEKAKRSAFRDDVEPDPEISAARWYQWVVRRSLLPRAKPERVEHAVHTTLPRISTSLLDLDETLGGGLYGFAAIAGSSGVGKSTIAWNTAMIAAQAGWTSVYLAAEMDPQDYEQRAARFLNCRIDEARDRMPQLFVVSDGLDFESLIDVLLTVPRDDTTHLLIAVDSMTKVARYAASPEDPRGSFVALAKLERMCESLVRFGRRRTTVIATSELNAAREMFGRSGTYSASVQIALESDKDQPDLIWARVDKGRYSAKTKKLGPFWANWRRHRLEPLSTQSLRSAHDEPETERSDKEAAEWWS